MIDDAAFRDLVADRAYRQFLQSFQKAEFTPAEKQAISDLTRYINVIARMILKEEGILVHSL